MFQFQIQNSQLQILLVAQLLSKYILVAQLIYIEASRGLEKSAAQT